MKKKKCTFLKSLLLTFVVCLTFVKFLPAQKNSQNKVGFSYILPYHFLEIDVKITKNVCHAGPFADYAEMLTEIENPIIENNDLYYEFSGLSLKWISEDDTTKIFPISSNHCAFESLAQNGLILEFGKNRSFSDFYNFENNENLQVQNRFYLYQPNERIQIFDTIYQETYVDSVKIKTPKIVARWINKSNEKQAQEVVDEIMEIRDNRKELLSGSFETDFSRLDLMLEGLNKRESDLSVLFTGYVEKSIETKSYRIVPQETTESFDIPLFSLSKNSGLEATDENDKLDLYTLKFVKSQSYNLPKEELEKSSKNRFYVNNPAYYAVYLQINGEIIKYLGIYPFAQCGTLNQIDGNLYKVEINPLTGELKSVKINK